MRGEHHRARRCILIVRRFIPACAGNTTHSCEGAWRCCGSSPHARGTLYFLHELDHRLPVHPRMRGEHSFASCVASVSCLVHPRMRGEHLAAAGVAAAITRFIPACAGNTDSGLRLFASGFGSSPHARGTRYLALCLTDIALGSSPHARGTPPRAFSFCA